MVYGMKTPQNRTNKWQMAAPVVDRIVVAAAKHDGSTSAFEKSEARASAYSGERERERLNECK